MKFRAPFATNRLEMPDIPATVPEALRANLRRTNASLPKRDAGTSPTRAKHVLDRILSRLVPTGDGDLSKFSIIDAEELALLKLLANRVKAGPLFTDKDLMKDLSRVLQKNKLLKQTGTSVLAAQKAPISIFALATMHNRQVDLGDGTMATLAIAADKLGNLAIFAIVGIVGFSVPGEIRKIGHWVFQTDLPTSRYCEQDSAPGERNPFVGDFELTVRGTLGRVQ
jgi:hypothetical protein